GTRSCGRAGGCAARPRRSRAPPSSRERGEREPGARWARPLREDAPPRALERLERGQAAAGEEPDRATDAAADARLQQAPAGEQSTRPLGLEAQQLCQLGARAGERGGTVPAAGPRRQ